MIKILKTSFNYSIRLGLIQMKWNKKHDNSCQFKKSQVFFVSFLLAEKILNPVSGNTTPSTSRWHAGITLRSLPWWDNLSETEYT